MKPKSRRSSRCLLCFSYCRDPPSGLWGGGSNRSSLIIPGAVNCIQLEHQLEKLFILKQILDIPALWCQQTLARTSKAWTENVGNDDGSAGAGVDDWEGDERVSGLGSWFKVCKSCMDGESGVREAWRVYQKLMDVQTRLAVIKTEIKDRMKDGVMSNWRSYSMSKGERRKQVEDDIRDMVFPELILELKAAERIKEEAESIHEDLDLDGLPYHPNSDCNSDEDNECLSSTNAEIVEDSSPCFRFDPQLLPTEKRRRGRPKRNERRPTSNNPLLYYSKHYGELKKIKFKWQKCYQCPAKYKRDEDLRKHLELHEERKQKGTTEKGEFDCDVCPFISSNLIELNFHKRNRHQRDNSKRHSCPKCDFSTRVWKVLKLHVSQFHQEVTADQLEAKLKKITCSGCAQVFGNKRVLNNHMKREHPELVGIREEYLECDHCQIKFANKQELHSHVYSTHERYAKYICDTCGKGFPFMSRLEMHKHVHHNQKGKGAPREHICHLCGCDYTARYTLEKHYKKIHPAETLPGGAGTSEGLETAGSAGEEFKCRYCDLTSPYKVVIQRHLTTHKEEMGHKCEQCGKCYTSEPGLKRHLRINHPLEKEEVPCPYCFKKYPSVEYMKDHVNKFCKLKKFPNANLHFHYDSLTVRH